MAGEAAPAAGTGAETPPAPQPTPPTQPSPPTPPPAPGPSSEEKPTQAQQVPYDRFKEVNDQLKAEREAREKLEKADEERKQAEMSEVEKANDKAAKEKERADRLEAEKVTLEKSGWVKAAAQAANAHNPGDVVRFVDLGKVEDEAAAKEVVAAMTKDDSPHSYLFGAHSGPQPLGSPLQGGESGGSEGPVQLPTGADGKVDEEEATRQFGRALANGLGLIRQR